mmetsp:Transcript_29465/g.63430  ORF Transcript_29465/g.63430 Transcript_29465/m.63430 type:complete len:236 (-) Transcript_29465:158-865(-)
MRAGDRAQSLGQARLGTHCRGGGCWAPLLRSRCALLVRDGLALVPQERLALHALKDGTRPEHLRPHLHLHLLRRHTRRHIRPQRWSLRLAQQGPCRPSADAARRHGLLADCRRRLLRLHPRHVDPALRQLLLLRLDHLPLPPSGARRQQNVRMRSNTIYGSSAYAARGGRKAGWRSHRGEAVRRCACTPRPSAGRKRSWSCGRPRFPGRVLVILVRSNIEGAHLWTGHRWRDCKI